MHQKWLRLPVFLNFMDYSCTVLSLIDSKITVMWLVIRLGGYFNRGVYVSST